MHRIREVGVILHLSVIRVHASALDGVPRATAAKCCQSQRCAGQLLQLGLPKRSGGRIGYARHRIEDAVLQLSVRTEQQHGTGRCRPAVVVSTYDERVSKGVLYGHGEFGAQFQYAVVAALQVVLLQGIRFAQEVEQPVALVIIRIGCRIGLGIVACMSDSCHIAACLLVEAMAQRLGCIRTDHQMPAHNLEAGPVAHEARIVRLQRHITHCVVKVGHLQFVFEMVQGVLYVDDYQSIRRFGGLKIAAGGQQGEQGGGDECFLHCIGV